MPDNSTFGDPGSCNFRWGPADPATHPDTKPDAAHSYHVCFQAKGHTSDCLCWYCRKTTSLGPKQSTPTPGIPAHPIEEAQSAT